MKLITVIGARPQFIKASMVSCKIEEHNRSALLKKQPRIDEFIVHTGQHYDNNLSDVFFKELNVPSPKYQLEVNGVEHGEMTGRMLERIEKILIKERPDCVLVYGDTNSTLAGALASAKMKIPVAHVESGLRSFDKTMPEEINRILTDHVSDFLFCPTPQSVLNLKNEGIDNKQPGSQKVFQVGDVMYDLNCKFRESAVAPTISLPDSFVLATVHRAGNVDNREQLRSIFSALNSIGEKIPVVLPLHPRTKKKILLDDILVIPEQLVLIDPVSYLEMLYLLRHCQLVITDSGGVQKEAFFCKKLCLTLRCETEWTELVDLGANYLAGTTREKILETWDTVIVKRDVPTTESPYGNGNASEMIVACLCNLL